MTTEIVSVAGITAICYLIGMIVRELPLENRWIPAIVGLAGGILGVVGFYLMADFPASDLLSAVGVGIASGLSATGLDQMYKQVKPSDGEQSEDE